MRDLIILFIHIITTVMRVGQPGGVRRDRRIRSRQTSIIDSQSSPPACPESTHPGSASRRILFALDSAYKASSGGDRLQTIDIPEFSSGDGAAQVSVAVFTNVGKETRPEGTNRGFDPGCRRNEAAKFDLGMSANRRAD